MPLRVNSLMLSMACPGFPDRPIASLQVIVDMMAGIGPFAVPAAQRGCQVVVHASHSYMSHVSNIVDCSFL